MTIYFDINKEAYGYPINNPIATIDDNVWANYAGTEKWDIINGTFTDITDTDDYKTKFAATEKATQIADLTSQIKVIDEKRIRAIAEPAVKDSTTGQTWLEYYNEQIISLRTQIADL
jgi:hypothetical protein